MFGLIDRSLGRTVLTAAENCQAGDTEPCLLWWNYLLKFGRCCVGSLKWLRESLHSTTMYWKTENYGKYRNTGIIE